MNTIDWLDEIATAEAVRATPEPQPEEVTAWLQSVWKAIHDFIARNTPLLKLGETVEFDYIDALPSEIRISSRLVETIESIELNLLTRPMMMALWIQNWKTISEALTEKGYVVLRDQERVQRYSFSVRMATERELWQRWYNKLSPEEQEIAWQNKMEKERQESEARWAAVKAYNAEVFGNS